MMKNLIFLLSLGFVFSSTGQDRNIEFRELSFSEALEASKEESKPIFMDCYTTWCGPCKWMTANIFTRNEIADYYNDNFVCVKFDMEKGEGLELAKEFSIRAYPTLIFVDAERNLLMKMIGAHRESQPYIDLGDNAKSEDYNLIALEANVKDHRKDAAYMNKYFSVMAGAGMVDPEEVNIYFKGVPQKKWSSEENWQIIKSVVEDIQCDVFQDVLANQEKYRSTNGDEVDDYILYTIQSSLSMKLYSRKEGDREKYLDLLAQVKGWNFKDKEEVIFSLETTRLRRENKNEYLVYCSKNVEKVIWNNADALNNIAWEFFQSTSNKSYMDQAEKWAARAVALNGEHHILDTYANILFANGKYKEALAIEEEAVKKAQATGADSRSYEDVILLIKSEM